MHEIFISYRRKDSSDITGRIFDHLKARYGQASLFKDVDNIPLGVDFRKVIDDAVSTCKVLLAVIGDDWLESRDSSGQRRIDQDHDFVRVEIESALKRNIPVIPVLVEGQSMPTDKDLPDSLKELAFRNATKVRPDPDFIHDMNRLFIQLDQFIKASRKGTVYKRVALVAVVLIILLAFFLKKLNTPQKKLTREETRIYQRYLSMAKAFEETKVWSSALENYQKAANMCPDNKEIQKAIERLKTKSN